MSATRRVGPLPVLVTAAEAAAFADAVAPGVSGVPLIFPVRFLALPEIRAALMEIADMARHVVLHEAQSFTAARQIHAEAAYFLTTTLTLGAESQPRITVETNIDDESGTYVGGMTATLRLLPMAPPT